MPAPAQACPKQGLDGGVIHHQPAEDAGNAGAAPGLGGEWGQLGFSMV